MTTVEVHQAMAHCNSAHFKIPPETKLIVAQGDYATLLASGNHSSSSWRGYVVPFVGSPSWGKHLNSIWVPEPADLPVLDPPGTPLPGPGHVDSGDGDWAAIEAQIGSPRLACVVALNQVSLPVSLTPPRGAYRVIIGHRACSTESPRQSW